MKRAQACVSAALLLTLACRTVPGRDVRYEPTPMPAVRAMLEMAQVGPGDVVYDLGSGDGRIPITAAKEYGARGVGVEIDPVLVDRAKQNAREAGVEDSVEFRLGDMYAADLRQATVVTLFLHPEPNLKLRPALRSQLQPGSRVVSYIWDMGDWKPDASRKINGRTLFLWRIPPAGNSGTQCPRTSPRSERLTAFFSAAPPSTSSSWRSRLSAGPQTSSPAGGLRCVRDLQQRSHPPHRLSAPVARRSPFRGAATRGTS